MTSEIKRVKFLLLFVATAFSWSVYSQNNDQVDATIQLYPTTVDSAEVLSTFITRDFTSEEDKVRAIYTWLINNVAYDPSEYKNFNYSFKNYRERNKKEEKSRKQIIKRTLQTGKAVCEGYAMVFEKLCQLQGIDNYLVRGDTKTSFTDIGRPFANNHMWNVAVINGTSFLFDATWGAGKFIGSFIKEPTYKYYKAAPKKLINTHYPAFFEDAFVETEITKEMFSNRPIIIGGFLEIDDIIEPASGTIQEMLIDNGIIEIVVGATVDAISYSYGEEIKMVAETEHTTFDNQTTFKIPLELGVKTLLVYFNGKPALGYRIN
ncbi:hypothetical protein ULMS_00210 [Patiriisocius marinistellae]|uniref:Transglutaminase-like domain-containing protein n=2 Tax=Patiriisocius marinistellae TaxID=2494560 RepID=A0A5J4FSX9_9FLAO|nr:hypothetical protein ULMS_00210 [Patiriisocius marinistellae]